MLDDNFLPEVKSARHIIQDLSIFGNLEFSLMKIKVSFPTFWAVNSLEILC